MKIRFKRDNNIGKISVEIEHEDVIVEINGEEINDFIQNRDIDHLPFTKGMTQEEKKNIKLMLDNLIRVILKE